MICCSCGIDVPPQFKMLIQKNECPNCGKEIVNGPMRELLDELKAALEKMPADPEGLAGWLLSNYELRKIGTGQPVTNFYGAKSHMADSNGEIRVRENTIFEQRAGVKKDPKLAELAKHIKERYGAAEEPHPEEIDPNFDPDPQYTAAALAVMEAGESGPIVANPSAVQEMREEFSQMYQDSQTSRDVEHPLLQNDRMVRLMKQQGLDSGEKVGKIKRG